MSSSGQQKGLKPQLLQRQPRSQKDFDSENVRGAVGQSVIQKKKAHVPVPNGLTCTDSLKALMKRQTIPVSMLEHIQVQEAKSSQLVERYLTRVAQQPRREASLKDPSSKGNIMAAGTHLTISNYNQGLLEYESLKGVLQKRFREVKEKDYRLYDDVDVDYNSCQMRITLHPFEELFRRKLVIDAKRSHEAMHFSTGGTPLKRSQTVMSPSPGGEDPAEESWIRKKLGILDAANSQVDVSKDIGDAENQGCCHGLIRCLSCRTDKVQPQQQEDDDEIGSDEEINDDSCCSCLLKTPSEEELKMLSTRYCDKSLNWLQLDNSFRLAMIYVNDSVIFETTILLLIISNSIMLGLVDYSAQRAFANDPSVQQPTMNIILNRAELLFTVMFTLEAIIKIVASGLLLEDGCYLRDPWNWLDFTVVVTGLLQTLPNMGKIGAIRTFRLFRPLRSLSAIPSMKILMTTLLDSIRQLSYIIVLNLAFVLVFAVFGMSIWAGVLNYRCRLTRYPENGDWLADPNDMRACSPFQELSEAHHCKVACGSLFELRMPNEQGIMTQYHVNASIAKNRDTFFEEFNYGVTNFDNFGSAYLTIFQCTTLEGWTKIKRLLNDGFGVSTSSIFFCLCVLICNYFLLNLTIAVMLDKFKKLNQANKDIQLVKFQKNAKRVQELKDLKGIMRLRKKKVTCEEHFWTFVRTVIYKNPGEPPRLSEEEQDQDRYRFWLCRMCWKFIKLPIFSTMITIIVLLNTLALAADRYPEPETDLIGATNRIFVALFSIELFVKLVGQRFDEWKADLMNIFDLIIVLSSVLELIVTTSESGIISAFRGVRLFRVFKLTRSNLTLRSLTDSMLYTFKAIMNFLLVFSLFIYVFALLGMDQFAGKFKFDSEGLYDTNGKVPRQNFDTILWAFVTVFQVLMGDRWPDVMYKAQLSDPDGASVVYFVVLVLVGKTIMLNLLLSIMLGNFEMSSTIIRAQVEDQILKEFEESRQAAQEAEMQRLANLPKLDQHRNQLMPYNINIQSAGTDQVYDLGDNQLDQSVDAGFRIHVERVDDVKQTKEVVLNGSFLGEDAGAQLTPVLNQVQCQKFDALDAADMQLKRIQDDMHQALDQKPEARFTTTEADGAFSTQRGLLETQRNELNLANTAHFQNLMHQDEESTPKVPLRERRGFEATVTTPKQQGNNDSPEQSIERIGGPFESDDSLFADEQVDRSGGCCNKVLDHMAKSSCFIFHREGACRKFMLRMTTSKREIKISDKDLLLSKIQNAGQQGDSDEDDDLDDNEDAFRDTDDISVSGSPVRWFEDKHSKTECGTKHCEADCGAEEKFTKQASKNLPIYADYSENLPESPQEKSKQDEVNAEARAGADLRRATSQDSTFARFLLDHEWARDGYLTWLRARNCIGVCDWTLNQWFEHAVYLLIFMSIIMLVIESPAVDPESELAKIVDQLERVITIFFAVEAVCRIIALGFLFGAPQRKAYLRSGSNQIDFFVVVGCDMILLYDRISETETLSAVTLGSFKVLRCLRALRPLRVVSRSEGLKLAVGSLLGAMPAIFTGMVVCQLVIFIYATIGVSLFKGRFRRCYFTGEQAFNENLLAQVDVEADCLRLGGLWLNADRNFDSIENALMALYEMIIMEGWMDVMYMAVDGREIGQQPKDNTSPYFALYFLSFLIVGNVFILNLFVGIVIDKFNRLKDSMCGYALMTSHQREWVETEKQMVRLDLMRKKEEPQVGWQLVFYKMTHHYLFDYGISTIILISIIEMSFRQYQVSDELAQQLDAIRLFVIIGYNLEAVLKILALRLEYIMSNWNRFELGLVLLIDLVLLLKVVLEQDYTTALCLKALLTLRVARIFSMVRSVKQLRMLLDSLLNILPAIFNVVSLISLMFFIFSIIGVNMFSDVRHQREINEHANFMSFGTAMVVLLRCATGENWDVIMRELASTNDQLHLLDITGRGSVKAFNRRENSLNVQEVSRHLEQLNSSIPVVSNTSTSLFNSTTDESPVLTNKTVNSTDIIGDVHSIINTNVTNGDNVKESNTTVPIVTEPPQQPEAKVNETVVDQNATVTKDDDMVYCLDFQTYEELQKFGPLGCGTWMAYGYFAAFTLVIRILMLNLFIAVVIEGFSTSYKEHTNSVRSEHFTALIKLWEYYDPKGTGWIGVNELMFLVFELDEPLGRKTDFETTIAERYEEIVKLHKTHENQYINANAKFVVNIEKNMIIPHRDALKLLQELNLPVYRDPGDGQFKCHFSDVVKRLSRFALDSMIPNFKPNGIQFKQLLALKHMWSEKYPDLKEKSRLLLDRERKVYTCYRYFAANYLVKIITNAQQIRKKALLQEQREASKSRFARLQKEEREAKEKAQRKSRVQKAKVAREHAASQSFISGTSRVTARSRHDRSEHSQGSDDDDDPVGKHIRETLLEQAKRQDKVLRRQEEIHRMKQQVQSRMQKLFLKKKNMVAQRKRRMSQDFDPAKVEDSKRSTWWMAADKNNYQMKQWVDDLDIQVAKAREIALEEEARLEREQAMVVAPPVVLTDLSIKQRRKSSMGVNSSKRSSRVHSKSPGAHVHPKIFAKRFFSQERGKSFSAKRIKESDSAQ